MCRLVIALALLAVFAHGQSNYKTRCVSEGIFPMTRGACESAYLSCTAAGSFAIRFECASSETRFDVISSSCRMPRWVATCGGISTTTTPVPQQAPTVKPFNFDCEGKRDIDYPNPNKPCSELYVSCSGGEPIIRSCPSATKFDIISRQCLADQFVKTCHGTATTPAPAAETTQSEPDNRCAGKAPGVHASSKGACSQVILACIGSTPQTYLCPTGLKFDVITEACLEEQWVAACGGQTTTPSTEEIVQAEPVDPTLLAFCAAKKDGNYASPIPCSPQFIACVGGKPTVYECPANLRYSAAEDQCLRAVAVKECSQFDESKNTCGGKVDGFYAHPSDCHKFIYCDKQEPLELDCAGDLIFDPNHMKCDLEEKVMAKCGLIQPEDVPDFSCKGLPLGFFTNINDCGSYYLCEDDGSRWTFNCEAGFAFSKKDEECRPAATVEDCMPPRVPEMTPFCESKTRNGIFERPGACETGIICLQNVAFELTCSSDKPSFDRYLLQCVQKVSAEAQCVKAQ